MPRKRRKYGGPGYGYRTEEGEALDEIRCEFPRNRYIIEHSPGSRGPADYKVFNRLSDKSKGKCVAVIQVKASPYIGGTYIDPYSIMRLRKSASQYGSRCHAWFLCIEHGKPKWYEF